MPSTTTHATYRQGESWVQRLVLAREGSPISVGPAAATPTLVRSIEVLLISGGAVAARYRTPTDPLAPDALPLTVDAVASNELELVVSRAQSLAFVPGFLTAAVLIRFVDAAFAEGRAEELSIPIGVVLRGETTSL